MRQTKFLIDHQPIPASQIGLSRREWQNGYGMPSDGADTNASHPATKHLTPDAKSLIVYFSRSGSTEVLASKIVDRTHADILEITIKNPYPGNYLDTYHRVNHEWENGIYPELKMVIPNLSQYQTIYLGYQIWAMLLSHPMGSFLRAAGDRFSGKRVVPFMTEGGYGQGASVRQIDQLLQAAGAKDYQIEPSLVVDGNRVDQADQQINHWLNK